MSRPHGGYLAAVRRPFLFPLIAVGILLFLVISGLLSRVFSVDGAERSAITGLVKDEARGDASAMVGRIERCASSAGCRARVAADAAALKRSGSVLILEINPSAGFSLGSTLGTARVAWRADGSLPVVQCVRVRRAGDVLSGQRVQLLELSSRIPSDSDCPTQF